MHASNQKAWPSYLVAARAGGHVQHSTVLSAVDVLATKHVVNLLAQLGRLSQLQKQLWCSGSKGVCVTTRAGDEGFVASGGLDSSLPKHRYC